MNGKNIYKGEKYKKGEQSIKLTQKQCKKI